MDNYIQGCDVSAVQGIISQSDWSKLYASGVRFVANRCGVGNNGIDQYYQTNINNARAAGLYVLAYHFIFALPATPSQPLRDPIKQAQYHFNAANGINAACDFEWSLPPDWPKWGVNAKFLNDWGLAYLQEYSNLQGHPMLIYSMPYFIQSVGFSSAYLSYPLWIASYKQDSPMVPLPWSADSWVLWQNGGGNTMKLPSGAPCDQDFAKDLSLFTPPSNYIQQPQMPPPIQYPAQPTIMVQQPSQTIPVAAPEMPSGSVSDAGTTLTSSNIISAAESPWRNVGSYISNLFKK